MVQRKGSDILCPRTEPKKSQPKQEKHLSSPDQGMRNKRSDLKRKLRKARSIKRLTELENHEAHLGHQHVQPSTPSVKSKQLPPKAPGGVSPNYMKQTPSPRSSEGASPNYMKPTTSSDARKERSQVNVHHPAANDMYKDPRNKGNSSPSRASPSASSKKPAKILTRKSSLKPVRPLMKKSSAALIFPEVSASKATCSSTLKDTRFPKELELSPGSTESEGTSMMKVCPFTYCSLNGHCHQPQPPLKSFISARRRLLKTQKSIKLKRLSSCRRRYFRNNEKQLDVEREVPEKFPLREDLDEDFFVEIYANPYEEFTESAIDQSSYDDDDEGEEEEEDENDGGDDDDMNSEIFSELLLACADPTGAETKASTSSLDEGCSEMNYDDNRDQMGEFSVSEMEVLAGFLEYIKNQEDKMVTPDGKYSHLTTDYNKWDYDGCLAKNSSDIGEDLSDNEDYEALLEAIHMNRGGEVPECTDDGTSIEGWYEGCTGEDDFHLQDIYDDGELDFLEELYGTGFIDQNSEASVAESTCGNDPVGSDGSHGMDEIFFSLVLQGLQDESTMEATEDTDFNFEKEIENNKVDGNVSLEEIEFLEQLFSEANQGSAEDGASEAESETKAMFRDEVTGYPNFSEDAFGPAEAELEDDIGLHELGASEEEPETVHEEVTKDPNLSEDAVGTIEEESEADKTGDDDTEEDRSCTDDGMETCEGIEHVEEEKTPTTGLDTKFPYQRRSITDSNQFTSENENKMEFRLNITRRNVDEDSDEELKAFNPRAPNFLLIEPGPESEKVDLRHQLMDERKNAQEWMIDRALQEVVSKLAPAQKKKVALIVEAIETVAPMPMYRAPLIKQGDMCFAHARPVQACS